MTESDKKALEEFDEKFTYKSYPKHLNHEGKDLTGKANPSFTLGRVKSFIFKTRQEAREEGKSIGAKEERRYILNLP